jgi:hypothetical protein
VFESSLLSKREQANIPFWDGTNKTEEQTCNTEIHAA